MTTQCRIYSYVTDCAAECAEVDLLEAKNAHAAKEMADKVAGEATPADEIAARVQAKSPTQLVDFLQDGCSWIAQGGNLMACMSHVNGIETEIIVKRKGFELAGNLEELAKDRIYTLGGFHSALTELEVNQIDGVPRAYMEFATKIDRIVGDGPGTAGSDVHVETETHIVRWHYSTLRFGSHLPDPVARIELLTYLFKTIKNCVSQLKDTCEPLIVWRCKPEFSWDTDQGITYLRARLAIPGVDLTDLSSTGGGVFWVGGV